jgi:hypothetical protein
MASNPVDRGGKEQKNARTRIGERMGEDIGRGTTEPSPHCESQLRLLTPKS